MRATLIALLVFASLMTAAVALLLGVTAFISWSWPINFGTWSPDGRFLYAIIAGFWLLFAFFGSGIAAAEAALAIEAST